MVSTDGDVAAKNLGCGPCPRVDCFSGRSSSSHRGSDPTTAGTRPPPTRGTGRPPTAAALEQVQLGGLRPHRVEREAESAHDPGQINDRRFADPERDPHEVPPHRRAHHALKAGHARALDHELLAAMGWRADRAELLQHPAVSAPLSLANGVGVGSRLARRGVSVLPAADIDGDLLGEARRVKDA